MPLAGKTTRPPSVSIIKPIIVIRRWYYRGWPLIEGTGETRLMLVLDPVADPDDDT